MVRFDKPPFKQAAFTLLELIIVVALLTIISAYVFTRPDTATDYEQDAVAEQIISAGRLTQQLSMNDSARTFSLEIQANQIDLLADGTSFSAANVNFPINLSSDITLSPVTSIVFDRLGRTSGTTISIQADTTQRVCFNASGLVERC